MAEFWVCVLIVQTQICSQLFCSLSPAKNQHNFCPSHWIPYAGHCYYLERSKKMWRDALAACHKDGGDLASIHNIEEQSFIISQSGYGECAKSHFFQ